MFFLDFTDLEFDCSNVKNYSGEYKCKMEGTMAGVTTAAESESVTVNTICMLWKTHFIGFIDSRINILKTKLETKFSSNNMLYCLFSDPAFWAGREKLVSASRDDEQIQIVCNVCAEPPIDSFTWLFNGSTIRGGIEEKVSQKSRLSLFLCKGYRKLVLQMWIKREVSAKTEYQLYHRILIVFQIYFIRVFFI